MQDSADDDSSQGNDITELQDNDTSREELRQGHDVEENKTEGSRHLDNVPQTRNERKREPVGRKSQLKDTAHDIRKEEDGNSRFESEAPTLHRSDLRGRKPAYSGRVSRGSRER